MLKKILVATLIVMAGAAAYIAIMIPKEFVVSRSVFIQKDPATLFPYANNPRKMQEWNPFAEGDPELKLSYTGPEEGVGAQSAWEGKSGIGQSTVVESEPPRRVAVRLDFTKPFEATNYGEYKFEEKDGGTQVTWTVNETSTAPRIACLFMDLDKAIGGQFEKGLANLKALVER